MTRRVNTGSSTPPTLNPVDAMRCRFWPATAGRSVSRGSCRRFRRPMHAPSGSDCSSLPAPVVRADRMRASENVADTCPPSFVIACCGERCPSSRMRWWRTATTSTGIYIPGKARTPDSSAPPGGPPTSISLAPCSGQAMKRRSRRPRGRRSSRSMGATSGRRRCFFCRTTTTTGRMTPSPTRSQAIRSRGFSSSSLARPSSCTIPSFCQTPSVRPGCRGRRRPTAASCRRVSGPSDTATWRRSCSMTSAGR